MLPVASLAALHDVSVKRRMRGRAYLPFERRPKTKMPMSLDTGIAVATHLTRKLNQDLRPIPRGAFVRLAP